MLKYLLSIFVLVCFCAAFAHEHEHEAAKMPKDFEKLKQLVGTWEGTKKGDKGDEKLTVSYELTSGGTAILEKVFAGTPMEMVSVYHANGDKVTMTHYCMLGNHPEMNLKKADDKTLTFEMGGMGGLKSKAEPHMHGLEITMTDKDHMKEEWTMYANGKKKDASVFNLARK